MSGYRLGPRPTVLTAIDSTRPVGFKQGNGDETFFLVLTPDWSSLLLPDGRTMAFPGAAQVQSDWTATIGMGVILNKPALFDGGYNSLSGRPTLFSGAYVDLTGKPSLFSGDYADLTNKPAAAAAPAQSSASRSLNTIFRPSTTRNCLAFYSAQITVTASIVSGQDGEIVLEIASDAAFTANVQTLAVAASSQVYTLAVALQGVQKAALQLSGFVPAGYYVRLRTVNTVGTPVFLYRAGQEVLL